MGERGPRSAAIRRAATLMSEVMTHLPNHRTDEFVEEALRVSHVRIGSQVLAAYPLSKPKRGRVVYARAHPLHNGPSADLVVVKEARSTVAGRVETPTWIGALFARLALQGRVGAGEDLPVQGLTVILCEGDRARNCVIRQGTFEASAVEELITFTLNQGGFGTPTDIAVLHVACHPGAPAQDPPWAGYMRHVDLRYSRLEPGSLTAPPGHRLDSGTVSQHFFKYAIACVHHDKAGDFRVVTVEAVAGPLPAFEVVGAPA